MSPDQHNLLCQLAQLGLQALTEQAQAALVSCAPPPMPEEPPPDPDIEK